MLKIKDSVNLKELEKYGFELWEYIGDIDVKNWYKDIWVDEQGNHVEPPELNRNDIDWVAYEKDYMVIIVFDKTEESEYINRQILEEDIDGDTLYDLIQDGLVEKVDE